MLRAWALSLMVLVSGCGMLSDLSDMPVLESLNQGDRLTMLVDKDQIFPAMYRAIDRAQESIQIDIFLMGGETGMELAEKLIAKRREGVDIQVVMDPNHGMLPNQKKEIGRVVQHLQKNGIEVRGYPIERLPKGGSRLTNAKPINHAKVVAVDGKVAFVGGMNFLDSEVINHDFMAEIVGPSAKIFADLVHEDYSISRGLGPAQLPNQPRQSGVITLAETSPAQQSIKPMVLNAIRSAKRSIHVEMLLMDHLEGIQELINASKRGVDVKVILDRTNLGKHTFEVISRLPINGAPNLMAVRMLLENGVQVAWYKPEHPRIMLHAKTILVDGQVTLMGTANFTYRAWHRNREIEVRLDDPVFTQQMEAVFARDWAEKADRITQLGPKARHFALLVEKFYREHYWGDEFPLPTPDDVLVDL